MDRVKLEDAAVRAVMVALESGRPFVRVTQDGPFLAIKAAGDEIDDPDCDEVYEAMQGGLFARFEVERGDVRSWRWMRLGYADRDVLAAALAPVFSTLDDDALAAVPVDMAFQGLSSGVRP